MQRREKDAVVIVVAGAKERIKKAACKSSFFILMLVSALVRNSQFFSTVSGRHSFSETMFVSSLSVGWLKCTFHCNISYVIIFSLRTAKVGIFFIVPKIFAKLSRFKWCFILIIRMISKLMAYVLIKWCFQTTKLIYPRIFLQVNTKKRVLIFVLLK